MNAIFNDNEECLVTYFVFILSIIGHPVTSQVVVRFLFPRWDGQNSSTAVNAFLSSLFLEKNVAAAAAAVVMRCSRGRPSPKSMH